MKTILLTLCLLFSLSGLYAQKAHEIAAGFENQKIEAIKAYLSANPEAPDKEDALSILVTAHMNLGQFSPIPDLLIQRYDGLKAGKEIDLNVIIREITSPLIESCINSNQRDKAKAFIARVKTDFANLPVTPQLNLALDQLAADLYLPRVGDEMEIAFTDLKGNPVDLEKLKDKIVLVDFWATWCPPCVAEMPNILATYEKYREKGFEVIGISLDDDKAALEKFVADQKLPWPQHFDGKGMDGEIATRYAIGRLPATFLLGKGNKIIAADLRGPQLEEAIEAALTAAE